MSIADNISFIKKSLPENVQLVAVSKTHPNEIIMEAYQAGQKIFGENKVQDLINKHETLPKDIQWHYIGHLQSNKVKYIAPFVHLLHGVDSLKLLTAVNKEGIKNKRVINCLLQVKIAQEDSKFGLSEQELEELLESDTFGLMNNVCIKGLMGMATFTPNMSAVQQEFSKLNTIFNQIQKKYFISSKTFTELSMGMSHDYKIAIEEGATMVRIGSSIFGERNY